MLWLAGILQAWPCCAVPCLLPSESTAVCFNKQPKTIGSHRLLCEVLPSKWSALRSTTFPTWTLRPVLHLASSCIELCGSSILFMPFALRMRPVVRFESSACNYCARLPICGPKAIECTAHTVIVANTGCSFFLPPFLLLLAPFYVATQRSVECATTKTSNKCRTAA